MTITSRILYNQIVITKSQIVNRKCLPNRDWQYGINFSTKTRKSEQKALKSERKQRKTNQNCKTLENDATAYIKDVYIIYAHRYRNKNKANQTQTCPGFRSRISASLEETDAHA